MASRISWIQPVRGAQLILGVAVFGIIIYVLTVYQYGSVIDLMLFNGIWTGFFVTPYLAMAPVHFFKLAYRVVVPALETSTLILWLVGVILLGIDLPSSGQCVDPGCKAALAAVVLAALECALFSATTVQAFVNSGRAHSRTTNVTKVHEELVPEARAAMEAV